MNQEEIAVKSEEIATMEESLATDAALASYVLIKCIFLFTN